MRVLVIDDSKSARCVLRSILEKHHYDVAEAVDGLEALQVLQRDPAYDLALVDWNMPILNGLDFVKMVRSDNCFDAIKMIMVTDEHEVRRINQALSAGAGDYIMKPYDESTILQTVKEVGC